VVSSDLYQNGIDFSPDGQWIAAIDVTAGLNEVINASTGAIQVLPFTGFIGSPTWLSAGSSYRRLSPTSPPSP
jgi:hypothetical protein